MQSRMLIHYYLIHFIPKELKAITGMEIKVHIFYYMLTERMNFSCNNS